MALAAETGLVAKVNLADGSHNTCCVLKILSEVHFLHGLRKKSPKNASNARVIFKSILNSDRVAGYFCFQLLIQY